MTGIPLATLRGRARGGPTAEARCLAGYVGKKFARIPLGATARYLGREESYLLKGVSSLEQLLDRAPHSTRLDAVIRKLRSAKSGFLD